MKPWVSSTNQSTSKSIGMKETNSTIGATTRRISSRIAKIKIGHAFLQFLTMSSQKRLNLSSLELNINDKLTIHFFCLQYALAFSKQSQRQLKIGFILRSLLSIIPPSILVRSCSISIKSSSSFQRMLQLPLNFALNSAASCVSACKL